jgi:hypothetical protein
LPENDELVLIKDKAEAIADENTSLERFEMFIVKGSVHEQRS